jgi:assimilatory nitrate reductase catalytic subunit
VRTDSPAVSGGPAQESAEGPQTATHCPYCALQCGLRVDGGGAPGKGLRVIGDPAWPANRGQLCVKGFTAAETLAHRDRLTTPLVRTAAGRLEPVSWDEALGRIAGALGRVQAQSGPDAAGVFGSGALTNEKAYLLGKFARVALGTSAIDYNGRFCMASGAAASNKALGLDRGLPFPLADLALCDAVLIAGDNVAETMPPFVQHLDAMRAAGGKLIVADPVRSATALLGALHLQLIPGSDGALACGLLHVLLRERLFDAQFLAERTEGFEAVRALAAAYWPERVERLTGVPEAKLVEAARLLGRARRPLVLTGRGPEQQAQGVSNALAYINLALALGKAGEPFCGYGTITGQGNGQGGREHGQKADQLPGYRAISDPAARRHLAQVWGVSEESIPKAGKSAYELLSTLGEPGGVRALFVVGSNPVVSAPRAGLVRQRLEALDFLAVTDFFLSETALLADVVLPCAQWAEEDGTLTNLEGRVIRRRRVQPPPAGVKTDLEILCALAGRLGHAAQFATAEPREVFEELRLATKGGPADYSGITYEKIDRLGGVFWPCPSEEHPGTERPFAHAFATPSGRARFHAVRPGLPAEEPDGDYPLYLTTGRLMAHYQSGTQTRRVDRLVALQPRPVARVHPRTARKLGLAEGALVTLTSRRGSAPFTLEESAGVREDSVWISFHWEGANRLVSDALDPVSRMPEFKVCAVRLEAAASEGSGV